MEAAIKRRHGGELTGIIDDALRVEITSHLVPNLSLVDLPGILAADRPKEPIGMMHHTRQLVERYLRMEHTMVLAVVPCYERIANNQGVQLVQQMKKERFTIGVLTMADMANYPGRDRFFELKQRLEGTASDSVHLPRGYITVKNRDNRVNGEEVTLEQAAQQELEWFDVHLPEAARRSACSSSGSDRHDAHSHG